MPEVHVRTASPPDHDAIAEILAEAYGSFAETAPHYHAWATTPKLWVEDASEVFVAVADDTEEVVGVVVLAMADTPLHESAEPPSNDAGFRLLAVAPHARGRGVARLLVEACLDAARHAGARRVGIFTMDFMDTAQRLYERMGFERRPDLDLLFPAGPGHGFTYDLTADAADHFPPPGPAADEPPWYGDVLRD